MANERIVLCGTVPVPKTRPGSRALRLALGRGPGKIRLKIDDIGDALIANLPDAFVDLLEIASYVYCADQAVTRGGAGVDNVGADWRRRLAFHIPVRVPELWSSASTQAALRSTLGFLSDDVYSFDFSRMVDPIPVQQYLAAPQGASSETEFDEVCLFSGGLDSLGGAIQEAVVEKRRVALVTHQPVQKLVSRYVALRRALTQAAAQKPLFVPVTINKDKRLGREPTQRSRSFLFAALGACVAQVLGLSRIRFYENGVVSFNLPMSAQVVGAKATRTTHPQVLNGFAEILSLVAGRRFEVENPFLWLTKTDIVKRIVDAGFQDLIRFSTSCAHTWEKTRVHPHCGSCSQCIDRRFAVLAASAAEADPEEEYKVRLLVDARPAGEERTMLAAYVESANAITQMAPLVFFSKFGEASRVLRHLRHSADSAAQQIFDLHKRHAQHVSSVVEQAVATHAQAILRRTLPDSCLVRLVCESGTSASASTPQPAEGESVDMDNVFRKSGSRTWKVRFSGGTSFVLIATRGAAYVHLLLSTPGIAWTAAKLAATVAGQPERYMIGDAGERIDPSTRSAYEVRHQELADELAKARANNDEAEQDRVQRDLSIFAAQLKGGPGARRRKEADNRERVRKAVGNAIKRATAEIAKEDRALAEHLQPPTLSRGHTLVYTASPQLNWST